MISIVFGVAFFTALIMLLSLIVLSVRKWLIPNKAVSLVINQHEPVAVNAGRKLLEVLNDINIPIPSACAGAGTCGLCKVAIVDGGGPLLSTEASRLTARDRNQQLRLACQVVVRNDMHIGVPEHILSAESWQSSVRSVRQLSPLIREIVFAMPPGKKFNFQPGEYVQVSSVPFDLEYSSLAIDDQHRDAWNRLGVDTIKLNSQESVTRAYSVANRPGEQDSVVLLIRLALPPPAHQHAVPPGIVSSWLFSRSVGDLVELSGPFGDFGLRDNDREMVLIGGGVGMAPLRSIIHHELATNRQRRVSFYYGARTQGDLFYQHEFDQMQKMHDRFHWTTALSDPQPDASWDGATGFIHEVFRKDMLDSHPHPEHCDYYLCGPPLMQRAVMSVLDDAGVDASNIFSDVFGE